MKNHLAPLLGAILLAAAAQSFALTFELDRPGLAIPKDFPAATRTNLLAVLERPECKFLGGSAFNSNTHLKYGGDTSALNRFLDALTRCPGLTLSIRFYPYGDDSGKLGWVVDHSGDREPQSVCVRVNLNSKCVILDDLAVPDTKGPALAAAPNASPRAVAELPATNPPAAAPLIRREVKQPNPGGKDLIMTFEELRREAKTSTTTVKQVSGASVPSAMFIARGAYDIAKARGSAYFINLKEWEAEGGTRMYLIGFAPDKNVDPKTYFDLKEPLPEDKRMLFLSVSAYERIFAGQP